MTAYIYDGLRTPFGRHAGALASVRPDDLLAEVIRAVGYDPVWKDFDRAFDAVDKEAVT